MRYFHGTIQGDQLAQRLSAVQALILDSDGVLTNNQVLEGIEDAKPRWRSHYDGQGISLLRAIGIEVCIITNEQGLSAKAIIGVVDRWNSLPSTLRSDNPNGWKRVELITGKAGQAKVIAGEEWLSRIGVQWERCAVMGDDLVDAAMLAMAGVKACPSSAENVIKEMADFVSCRPGGSGAVRDLANFILECRKIDPLSLPLL